MAECQPFQQFLEPGVVGVRLVSGYRVVLWRRAFRPVAGPWHDAISRTFSNRTIVTGDVR